MCNPCSFIDTQADALCALVRVVYYTLMTPQTKKTMPCYDDSVGVQCATILPTLFPTTISNLYFQPIFPAHISNLEFQPTFQTHISSRYSQATFLSNNANHHISNQLLPPRYFPSTAWHYYPSSLALQL